MRIPSNVKIDQSPTCRSGSMFSLIARRRKLHTHALAVVGETTCDGVSQNVRERDARIKVEPNTKVPHAIDEVGLVRFTLEHGRCTLDGKCHILKVELPGVVFVVPNDDGRSAHRAGYGLPGDTTFRIFGGGFTHPEGSARSRAQVNMAAAATCTVVDHSGNDGLRLIRDAQTLPAGLPIAPIGHGNPVVTCGDIRDFVPVVGITCLAGLGAFTAAIAAVQLVSRGPVASDRCWPLPEVVAGQFTVTRCEPAGHRAYVR